MSKKERLASFLDRITDLCFSISELEIGESSTGEVAKPSTLRPEAAVFTPSSKGKEKVSEDQRSESSVSEDWESVPDLPSASVDTPPTFSQVVGSSSRSVYVTPVKKVLRAQSVDSAESGVSMAAPPPAAPDFTQCTAAQFEAYWQALGTEAVRVAAETLALGADNPPVAVVALTHRQERDNARIARLNNQLGIAQAQIAAANAQATARASPPSKFESKEGGPDIRQFLDNLEEYLVNTPNAEYIRIASSYLNGKPRSYWTSQWTVYQREHAAAPYPANARQVFREVAYAGADVLGYLEQVVSGIWQC